MDKATMLYNKFKSMFLVGEGDSVLSQVLNKSIAEQRQFEEARKGALKRAEQTKENNSGIIHYFIFSCQHFKIILLFKPAADARLPWALNAYKI